MRNKYLILAFLEGFFFLSFELLGVQLLQPFYGSSYFVWIGTLCIVMLSSGIGYFTGAVLAKKTTHVILRFTTIFILLNTVILFSYYQLNETLFVAVQNLGSISAFIVNAMLLIGVPVFLISVFSPIIIAALSADENWKGKAASSVFTYSTVGGIVSVYLLAFILLPNLELIQIIYGMAVAFTVAGSTLFWKTKNKKIFVANVVLALILFVLWQNKQKPVLKGNNTEIVFRTHGILGEIEIRDEHKLYRYLNVNRMIQSGVQIEKDLSAMSYPFRISMYASSYPANSKVLIGGLGGGVLVNQMLALQFDVDVVDFDKRLYDVGKKYMHLNTNFHFEVDDFRHYINSTDNRYDIVVVDLSKGESIPSNVYTVEAFKQINTILNPNGTIYLNYFSRTNGLGDQGMNSVIKTLRRAGYFVGVVRKPVDDNTSEEIIIASNNPAIAYAAPFRMPAETIQNLGFVTNNYVRQPETDPGADVLFDDRNILEKRQFEVILDLRSKSRNNEVITFYNKKNKK